MMHFDLTFMKSIRSMFIFVHIDIQFASNLSSFVEKSIHSPLDCLFSFVKDSLTVFVWVCFLALQSGPVISVLFFHQHDAVIDYLIVCVCVCVCVCVRARSVMSGSLRPHYCGQPGSPVRRIFQARILEWVAISYSRG